MIGIDSELKKNFQKESRYSYFGECINAISVSGIRGVTCDAIRFEYPVTAFTGVNGAGKTTIMQLLACAYRKKSNSEIDRQYISRFFTESIADGDIFDEGCAVEYFFHKGTDLLGTVEKTNTIRRESSRWRGYRSQPARTTLFVGPAFYLPKYERSDLSIYEADYLTSIGRYEIQNGKAWISNILGSEYEDVFIQSVKGKSRNTELGMAQRMNARYSENNMGLGEGRIIRIVRDLETCPERSLIVLDEADIGLHSSAKRRFSRYLMSVSYRRGHQIFFSTHSSEMVNELPEEGRKMLERHENEVKVYDGLSSTSIRQALTEGKHGFLIVCVEDIFAKNLLESIISEYRSDLANLIKVH